MTSASLEPRMRCDLTGELCAPPDCSADVWDRVNVPRDMSVWAARRLRHALETNASIASPKQAPAIPADHRRDQNPASFLRPPLPARQ
jgi:glutathione S-transferase